jgi:hypothetical protein
MRRSVYSSILFCLAMTAASLASAADLCITLETSGTVYVFKGAALKRGKTFPLNGYSNHFIGFPDIAQYPVVGQAILSSDGKTMILGLTEYDVNIAHDIGSHQVSGGGSGTNTKHEIMQFESGSPLRPGSTGGFSVSESGGTSENAVIINCGTQDSGLTPP